MTEIGRRTAILSGTIAFAMSVLVGIFYGDLVKVCLLALAAGLIFGTGGMLIGNLIDGYIIAAAKRELARQALEKELRMELAASEAEKEINEAAVEFPDEVSQAPSA